MIPDLPEILIILFISLSIFGLIKLDAIGRYVWRLRRRWFDSDG